MRNGAIILHIQNIRNKKIYIIVYDRSNNDKSNNYRKKLL